jgi:hypothetical protein
VLGYQSHLQAQNLRVGCAMIIALLYPTQNNYLMTVIAPKLVMRKSVQAQSSIS